MATFDINAVMRANDQVSKEFTKIGNSANKLGNKINRLGKTASIAGGFMVASLALSAGKAIESFASNSITRFFAQQDAIGQLKGAVTNMGMEWEDVAPRILSRIDEIGDRTGELTPRLVDMLAQLIGAGIPMEDALDLLSIAVDVSTRFGKSLETVTDEFRRAFSTGALSTLEVYGVTMESLTAAGIEFSELDLGEPWRKLRDIAPEVAADLQEKLQEGTISQEDLIKAFAAYGIIVEQKTPDIIELFRAIGEATKGAADLSDEATDRQKKNMRDLDEASQKLGAVLAPIQVAITDFFTNFLIGIIDFKPEFDKLILDLDDRLGWYVNRWEDKIDAMVEKWQEMARKIVEGAEWLWKRLVGGSIWKDTFEQMEEIEGKAMKGILGDVEQKGPRIADALSLGAGGNSMSITGPLINVEGNADEATVNLASRRILEGIQRTAR